MNFESFIWLAVSVSFEVVGDIFTRSAAERNDSLLWVSALIAYNAMLVSWLFAVNAAKLIAIPGLIWLVGGSTAVVLIGCFGFHEKLTGWQLLGMIFAAISMVFLSV